MSSVDMLVVTAANEAQARGYRAQLAARAKRGTLNAAAWRVIGDPGGRRVGSGASTFWVLHEVAKDVLGRPSTAKGALGSRGRKLKPTSLEACFDDRRVLIIHSGGDSRRLAAYAAQGKVFTPLPCNTPAGDLDATLFDLVLDSLATLPATEGGEVLIASGDVLLTSPRMDALDLSGPGVIGVACWGELARGSRHGVYVTDAGGQVVDFLQKPDLATARERHAVSAEGQLLIDTGLLRLDPATAAAWLTAAGVSIERGRILTGKGLLADVLAGRTPSIDLYEQVLMAMPGARPLESYLNAVAASDDAAHRARLIALYRALHGTPFHSRVLPDCEFFHIGTHRELIAGLTQPSKTAHRYGFRNRHNAAYSDPTDAKPAADAAFIYNSRLAGPLDAGAAVLIESTATAAAIDLPGSNILVGWPESSPSKRLALPMGWGLVALPVPGGKWTVVAFGLDDDFKTSLVRKGTFGGQPLTALVTRSGLDASQLWAEPDPEKQTLWNARLWSAHATAEAALAQTRWLVEGGKPARGWARRPRWSMQELIAIVDHQRLISARERVTRDALEQTLAQRITGDPWAPAGEVADAVIDASMRATLFGRALELAQSASDPLDRSRLFILADTLAKSAPAGRAALKGTPRDMQQSAFAAVAAAVAQTIDMPRRARPAAIQHDQAVWVTTPVRLDFAGGWSDTPPICTELGGAVLNAAITLNGQYPVQVIAKLTPLEPRRRPGITLTSMDLGKRTTLTTTAAVLAHQDPRDWAALPKAALVLAGLAPASPREQLYDWLHRLGGGLDITFFSALPKGSGLGTSSVLGAALLACLARVIGDPLPTAALINRTSLLEQLMTTGGGWQDQIGGATPGAKLIRTRPGADQTPTITPVGLDVLLAGPLAGRALLFYTGYKRMARHILQNVVTGYLARDPRIIDTVHRLKGLAERLTQRLLAGDAESLGPGIAEYWALKKQIDPGSTNPDIESLLTRLAPHASGMLLPGAGGGGFVFILAKDAGAAQIIRADLQRHPPNPLARFFDFAIDQKGLAVTVL